MWAWDTVRDTWCLAEVDRTFVHAYEGDVIAIAVGEGTIESTGNHPFWVVTGENLADRPAAQHVGPEESPLTNRGRWVDARDLRAGDLLRSRQGGHTVVASISTRQEELTVYNIAVAGHRTYAVGRCGALVHNKTTDAEGGGGASSKPANSGTSANSTAFEIKLNPSDFGKSRSVHFNRANAALDAAMSSDAELGNMMERLIPGARDAVTRTGGRANPPGWTWEHVPSNLAGGEKGIMRLVPTGQHTPGSPWWRVIHPNPGGAGGYSEWAIPAGAPPN